jgi:serine/threonine protein kinase
MMCGRAPFEGSGYGDILAMQIKTPPLPPSVIEPMIPPEVDALILRALSKDPAGRHSDMRAMSREIDAILAQYDAVLETSASSRRRASTGGLRPNDIVDRWEQELDTPSVVIGLSPEDEDVDIHVDADVDFDIDVDVEDEDEDEDEDGPKTAVQTPARMLAEAARRRRRAKSQSAPLPTRAPTAEPPRVPAKARSAAAPPQSSGSRTRAPRVDQSVAARVGGEPEIIAIDIGEAAFLAREAGAAAVVEDRRAVPWFALALFALVLLGTLLGISLR